MNEVYEIQTKSGAKTFNDRVDIDSDCHFNGTRHFFSYLFLKR